ncbi:MAG: preprotein translocase subunit SecE [Zetaproteobacteria bacterium CG12_big_fil_rev_8_21_14_0_65_55_1124]|nr:MAG: preprotein translocase subunit SecE [Zetaproteobacteria bacterium CG1_02_55_237]PIS19563.1 MAG: preprotein translocase subunit SecE [Zetaproteobacteria bacterium CG08_land_8_20_14_0_20_55_17]PIW42676.1 MAG: preprotein translocase subunit SecE [Zetaproteobacteria bacterium CG12_big_fil_rev_8_21_14_0_65_55_1124]PIY52043.1 MAG: preprotein translocase subunit SecE [Zetaproteobacteria bacterium CG_4_10_14_0_8_um_filter_55_43]PIZ38967.1 MAG: preprotein translocase subunit SecE [Zetaproteobact
MSRIAAAQQFMREVRAEAKKVVWPERKEAIQSTLMVLVMVIFVALFLWAVDGILGWLVQKVI